MSDIWLYAFWAVLLSGAIAELVRAYRLYRQVRSTRAAPPTRDLPTEAKNLRLVATRDAAAEHARTHR